MDIEDRKEEVHTDVSVKDAKPAPETDADGNTPTQDRSDLMELKAEEMLDNTKKGTYKHPKEKLQDAKKIKEEGNNYFKSNKLQEAVAKYQKVMDYLDEDKVFYGPDMEQRKDLLRISQLNLSMCYIKLGKFKEARDTCSKVIEDRESKRENIVKAWFRRGEANFQLKDFENAKEDFEKILLLEPNNKAAINKLVLSQEAVQIDKEKERKSSAKEDSKMTEDRNFPTLESHTSEKRVLFVEGFEQVEWMAEKLLGIHVEDISEPHEEAKARKAWQGLKIDRCAKISDFARKIASGLYKGIVVVDLSYDHEKFEQELGGVLQSFVKAGGVVAFPTSEGLQLAETLGRLFDTVWEPSSYYRSTWDISRENSNTIANVFGDLSQLESLPFSAKVASVKNVPPHEQYFRIKSGAKTQSQSFFMFGPGFEVGPDDVCVAVHKYGSGSIAFFGDVNCEIETVQLLAAYIRKRVDPPLNQEA